LAGWRQGREFNLIIAGFPASNCLTKLLTFPGCLNKIPRPFQSIKSKGDNRILWRIVPQKVFVD